MCSKTAVVTECLLTQITSIRALTTMCALMCYQSVLLTECFLTNITAIRMLTNMYALMFYKIALINECLIIHITSIRELSTMYVHVIRLACRLKALFHITNIRALNIMHALMCYKIALLSECLIKHKYWGVHLYVCVDVLSE